MSAVAQAVVWQPRQALLPGTEAAAFQPVAQSAEVARLHSGFCNHALNVSGGKDSVAMAHATATYLRENGIKGEIVLIHCSMGQMEWASTEEQCQRLADQLGLELVVTRLSDGGLLPKFQQRWARNLERYANLETVKILLPWSTPKMRFCTSAKVSAISSVLNKRWPKQDIINCTGIRHAESAQRSKQPVSKEDAHLVRKTREALTWNSIIHWSTEDVWRYLATHRLPVHEAYSAHGASRLSCSFCIMSSRRDLIASAKALGNVDTYRAIVDLESQSTFAFHGSCWLADVAPELLTDAQRRAAARAKERAFRREQAEARIPEDLLFDQGRPKRLPSGEESRQLANIRKEVAEALEVPIGYLDPDQIQHRYQELMIAA